MTGLSDVADDHLWAKWATLECYDMIIMLHTRSFVTIIPIWVRRTLSIPLLCENRSYLRSLFLQSSHTAEGGVSRNNVLAVHSDRLVVCTMCLLWIRSLLVVNAATNGPLWDLFVIQPMKYFGRSRHHQYHTTMSSRHIRSILEQLSITAGDKGTPLTLNISTPGANRWSC